MPVSFPVTIFSEFFTINSVCGKSWSKKVKYYTGPTVRTILWERCLGRVKRETDRVQKSAICCLIIPSESDCNDCRGQRAAHEKRKLHITRGLVIHTRPTEILRHPQTLLNTVF